MHLCKKAEEINDRYNNSYVNRLLYNRYGTIYLLRKEYDKALEYFKLYEDAARDGNDVQALAQAIYNIGSVYESKNELEKALRYYEEARDRFLVWKAIEDVKRDLAQVYWSIGLIHKGKADWEKAVANFEKGLKLSEEFGHLSLMARISESLGTSYDKMGKYEPALEYLNSALQAFKLEGKVDKCDEILRRIREIQEIVSGNHNTGTQDIESIES